MAARRLGITEAVAKRGWRRYGRKRFRYVDAHDEPITDQAPLERIRALAIPPAWTDVWISPNPGARLQATGVDTAGRKQYLYSAAFRAAQEREKYERLLGFGKRLPQLRARTARHLRLESCESSGRARSPSASSTRRGFVSGRIDTHAALAPTA